MTREIAVLLSQIMIIIKQPIPANRMPKPQSINVFKALISSLKSLILWLTSSNHWLILFLSAVQHLEYNWFWKNWLPILRCRFLKRFLSHIVTNTDEYDTAISVDERHHCLRHAFGTDIFLFELDVFAFAWFNDFKNFFFILKYNYKLFIFS